MDTLVSLVWVIAATVVAVPLVLTVVLPFARVAFRVRATPMARPQAAAGKDERPRAVEIAEIDTTRTEAAIEASPLTKLHEQIDAHPDEARAVLRNWLQAA